MRVIKLKTVIIYLLTAILVILPAVYGWASLLSGVALCVTTSVGVCGPVTATNPLPVTSN